METAGRIVSEEMAGGDWSYGADDAAAEVSPRMEVNAVVRSPRADLHGERHCYRVAQEQCRSLRRCNGGRRAVGNSLVLAVLELNAGNGQGTHERGDGDVVPGS